MKNNRLIKVNDEIRKEAADFIRGGLSDPRIHLMTTVTAVETTQDLSHTKIFISVMGSAEEKANTLAGLNSAKGFIRKHLAKTVDLRRTPQIHFELDETLDHAMKIDQLLNEVKEDD